MMAKHTSPAVCPFCGAYAQQVTEVDIEQYAVFCRCGSSGPSARTRESAVSRWNERASKASGDIRPPDINSVDATGAQPAP